jgi:RND family efflux transporter MFP subunit
MNKTSSTFRAFRLVALLAIAIASVGVCINQLKSSQKLEQKPERPQETAPTEVWGKTQCVPKRKAVIAPAAAPHPVMEVLVALGDRVKKGQPLVKIDDDEPQADLRAKQAILEGAEALLAEAQCRLEATEKGHKSGAVSEEHYHDIRTAAIKAQKDAHAAKAVVAGAKAELEHFVVEAAIDGVVNRLDVHRGTVSRPGTTVWGEILDLSEIDVRCELNPEQVSPLVVGQSVEVRAGGKIAFSGKGQVIFIGLSADKSTGLIPVLVRLPNPDARLRCEMSVLVRFVQPGR